MRRCAVGSGRSPEAFGGFGRDERFRAHAASRFGSRRRVQSARVDVRLRAGAGSIAARRVGALCCRGRGVAASSFAPRLAPVRERPGDVTTSETSDSDDFMYEPAAEQSGRVEPLPSVSVAELARDWGRFPCLSRCAVGSGRSPEAFGGFEWHARFRAHTASRFWSRRRVQGALVVLWHTAGAGSRATRRVGALCSRDRSASASSFGPRLAPIRGRLGDSGML